MTVSPRLDASDHDTDAHEDDRENGVKVPMPPHPPAA
jgi:hypothetical protein